MSKIKLYLEELAEIQLNRANQVSKKIPANPESNEVERKELLGSAKVLGIITSALVELGESTSIASKIKGTYIELTTCDWEGNSDQTPIKIKPEAILSYNEQINSNDDKEIKLIDIQSYGRSFMTKMTLQEFEKLLFGDHE